MLALEDYDPAVFVNSLNNALEANKLPLIKAPRGKESLKFDVILNALNALGLKFLIKSDHAVKKQRVAKKQSTAAAKSLKKTPPRKSPGYLDQPRMSLQPKRSETKRTTSPRRER